MNDKERIAMLKVRLRTLKRRYAKLAQHPEMAEECIELKADIDSIERELSAMR